MAATQFKIKVDGFWREQNKSALPDKPGIYCVYAGTLDEETISRLIYVGAAENVNEKLAKAEKLSQWESYLSSGEQLCYTFGAVDRKFAERCAAAIVFIHKPPANTDHVDQFQFEQTLITLSGLTPHLKTTFLIA